MIGWIKLVHALLWIGMAAQPIPPSLTHTLTDIILLINTSSGTLP